MLFTDMALKILMVLFWTTLLSEAYIVIFQRYCGYIFTYTNSSLTRDIDTYAVLL